MVQRSIFLVTSLLRTLLLLSTFILFYFPAHAQTPKFIEIVEYLEENKHRLAGMYEQLYSRIPEQHRGTDSIACSSDGTQYFFYGYPVYDPHQNTQVDSCSFAFQIRPGKVKKKPAPNSCFFSYATSVQLEFDETNCWMLATPERRSFPKEKPEALLRSNGGMVFFIRKCLPGELAPSSSETQFKTLNLTRKFAEGFHDATLRPDSNKGYLCYCVNTGEIEACVGIRSDMTSAVPGHSSFISGFKSPVETLQAVEADIMRRLLEYQIDIQRVPHKIVSDVSDLINPRNNPASIPGKFVSTAVDALKIPFRDHGHYQLKIVGVGQFSVVFQLLGLPNDMYKNVVWKRISGFTQAEAEDFVLLQKLSHRVFQECNVNTENTGYFIVSNPWSHPATYSVYMAQRLIPDYEFVDFHFKRFATCENPQNKSLLLEVSSKREIYPDKVIPLSEGNEVPIGEKYLTMSYEQVVVCIIDKILDMAASNLKDTLRRRELSSAPAPLQICGDIKADNISVKLRIINRSRTYSQETRLDATAEIFDTHPNTLEVHGCPVYRPEAYADHIKDFLGVDAFSIFNPAIKSLSNLPKIVIRTLACFLNYQISDERLEAVIDVTKAMIRGKIKTQPVWQQFPLDVLTIEAIRKDHDGANLVLRKLKLQTLALQMAQALDLEMSQSVDFSCISLPSFLPPPTSLIPISRAQDVWLRKTRESCGRLWKEFEDAIYERLMMSFFLSSPQKNGLALSRTRVNQAIESILKLAPFCPEDISRTPPIPIPSQLVTGRIPSGKTTGAGIASGHGRSLSGGQKHKSSMPVQITTCKSKLLHAGHESSESCSPKSSRGRGRPGIKIDKSISTALAPAQFYKLSRPYDVKLSETPAKLAPKRE